MRALQYLVTSPLLKIKLLSHIVVSLLFVRACCGDRFTVLLTDNGIVMSFGDGDYGCMGHGDWSSVSRPKLVEGLLAVDTVSLSCGPRHVCAVCDDGSVYTWGCGMDGRLGLNDEDNR